MKKLISILAVGMFVCLSAVYAVKIADWGVSGGTAKLDESGGSITLTVDAISATTVSGAITATGGFSGVVTNSGSGYTNLVAYSSGICTNVTTTGTP